MITTHLSEGVLENVIRLQKVFGYLKKYDPEMQAQMMRAFLWTAPHADGITMADLQMDADMSPASASRIIQALSAVGFKGRKGLGWVVATEDPMERRRKIVRLTPKGKRVLEDLKVVNK